MKEADYPADIADLLEAMEAVRQDAESLVSGLTGAEGVERPRPDSWSVAECLEHMGKGREAYLKAMESSADAARRGGRLRRRPAAPGPLGAVVVHAFAPPVKWWSRVPAPPRARPRSDASLEDSMALYRKAHEGTKDFLIRNADLELAGIGFPNPFVPLFRFSLATGLHILVAHDQRHLEQAWRVRKTLVRDGQEPVV